MARIQYNPSAQRRGFKTQQLSTEGISRMREESNRIIQGLQENRIAEAKQREIDRRAMEDNAAYQERMLRENFEIEQQNLRNQQQQALANIQGEQQQAQIETNWKIENIENFRFLTKNRKIWKIGKSGRKSQNVKNQNVKFGFLDYEAQHTSLNKLELWSFEKRRRPIGCWVSVMQGSLYA